MEAWQAWRDKTEVREKDGKYYLKGIPKLIYDTFEEAKEVSETLRDMIVF